MPQLPRGVPIDVLRELIKASESGNFGGYNALAWHPNYNPNAMARPVNEYGFPQWEGSRSTGLGSHGAGAYQFEPKIWGEFAPGLGVTDFSPESQDKVATAVLQRYGIRPWSTNRPLQGAIRAYQQTGAMPQSLVAPPQPPAPPGGLEAGAPSPMVQASSGTMPKPMPPGMQEALAAPGDLAPQQLPPPDELLRGPAPNFRAPSDFGGLAQPYRGPQTGDPVINQPQVGTYDRDPTMLTPELRHQIRNPPYVQMPVSYPNLGFGSPFGGGWING